MAIESSQQYRLCSSNVTTAGGVTALSSSRYTEATLRTALGLAATAALPVISLVPAIGGTGRRGAELTFFGVGAENAVGYAFVWRMKWARANKADPKPEEIDLKYMGSAALTMSSITGRSGSTVITSADLIVDAITWTPSTAATTPAGPSAAIDDAYGSPPIVAYSSDEEGGILFLTDAAGGDFLIELVVDDATSLNAVVDSCT